LNGATKPLSAITGGIIPPFCPQVPSEQDLKKPGVAGAANAAKKEALEAKERQAAVRYLGTLDCRYYPDAAGALAAALRSDGSECVRYEAALMLGRGCCCNQKTIAALTASMAGTEDDGHPAERSVRVRCAAAAALERCLSCYIPPAPDEEEKKEDTGEKPPMGEVKPGESKSSGTVSKASQLPPESRLPTRTQAERAARTLAAFQQQIQSYGQTVHTAVAPKQDVNLIAIVKNALSEMGGSVPARTQPQDIRPVMANVMPADTQPNVIFPTRITQAEPPVQPQPEPAVVIPSTGLQPQQPIAPQSPTVMPTPAELPKLEVPAVPMPAELLAPRLTIKAYEPAPAILEAPKPAILAPVPVVAPLNEVAPAPREILTPVRISPTPPVTITQTGTTSPETSEAYRPRKLTFKVTPPTSEELLGSTVITGQNVGGKLAEIANKVESGETAADRHAAIRELVRHDWKTYPQVVAALLHAARNDQDRVVRVDGIRHVSEYGMNESRVILALEELKGDADHWVADEAAKALEKLKPTQK
jgi:hypothetical protein